MTWAQFPVLALSTLTPFIFLFSNMFDKTYPHSHPPTHLSTQISLVCKWVKSLKAQQALRMAVVNRNGYQCSDRILQVRGIMYSMFCVVCIGTRQAFANRPMLSFSVSAFKPLAFYLSPFVAGWSYWSTGIGASWGLGSSSKSEFQPTFTVFSGCVVLHTS